MKDNFIYFPAISVGPMMYMFNGEKDYSDDIKFYNSDNKYFYHPYVLVSAGHLYDKKPNFLKDSKFNLKKGILFGDSGGFQIATGKIKYSEQVREDIFNWLENNTNLAVNLDIPPYSMGGGTNEIGADFAKSLKVSAENFEWFCENQTGKTRFLNVLQGDNHNQREVWYERVKDYNFGGWTIGLSNKTNIYLALSALFFLMERGEFNKKNNLFFHVLGASSLKMFTYLIYFAALLKRKGYKTIITSDSSTPVNVTRFGNFYIGHDFLNFKMTTFSNKHKIGEHIAEGSKIPCSCKVCESRLLKDIYKWDSESYCYMNLHNMNIFLEAVNNLKKIMYCECDELIYEYFPSKVVNNLKLIKKCFEVDSPTKLLRLHSKDFQDIEIDQKGMNDFF